MEGTLRRGQRQRARGPGAVVRRAAKVSIRNKYKAEGMGEIHGDGKEASFADRLPVLDAPT